MFSQPAPSAGRAGITSRIRRIFSAGTSALGGRQQLENRLFMLVVGNKVGLPIVNVAAFQALGAIGSAAIIPRLMSFPREHSIFHISEIRDAWLEALSEIALRDGNEETLNLLHRTHQSRGMAGDSYLQEGAIRALGKMAASGHPRLAGLAKAKLRDLWSLNWKANGKERKLYSQSNPYVLAELVRQTDDPEILENLCRLCRDQGGKLWEKEEDDRRSGIVWQALLDKHDALEIHARLNIQISEADIILLTRLRNERSPKPVIHNRVVNPQAVLKENGRHPLRTSLSAANTLLTNNSIFTSQDLKPLIETLRRFFSLPSELPNEKEEILPLFASIGRKCPSDKIIDFLSEQLNSPNPTVQTRAALALKYYFEGGRA